jgi:putative oxidoreductase
VTSRVPTALTDVVLRRLLGSRVHGPMAWLTAALRVATGVAFAAIGTGKFVDHAKEVADFDRYGVPIPDVAVYAVGALEVVCGAMLLLGLLTRVAAFFLALNLVGAISTAGRVEGGSFHLGVAPTLLVAMLILLWIGSGAFSCDQRLGRRVAVSSPTLA